MTGEQLFQRAAALLGQELPDTAYLRTFALPCINQLLWDTLHCQQALERSRGAEATQSAPRLSQFEEEIPYEDGPVFRMGWQHCWLQMMTARNTTDFLRNLNSGCADTVRVNLPRWRTFDELSVPKAKRYA